MGVEALPHCGGSFFCYPINSLAKGLVYTEKVQKSIGPAGYFRNPKNMKEYMEKSVFLPDLNNERNKSEKRK